MLGPGPASAEEQRLEVGGELVEHIPGLSLDDTLPEGGELAPNVRLPVHAETAAPVRPRFQGDRESDLDGTPERGIASGGDDGEMIRRRAPRP